MECLIWTPTTRREHSRDHLRYGSDLTDVEWEIIAPFLPPAGKTGRPRRWPMREIMNAIFYVLRSGCPWRMVPDFQSGAPTLEPAVEAHLGRPKLRSDAFKETVRGYVDNHLRDWLRLPLDEITRGMVVVRHGELAHIPSGANHLFRAFRSIWNHARRTYNLPEPPTNAIEWYDEQPDGRIIEDLSEWRQTVDELENPIHAAYYRLLLFTGLRKSEAAALRWRDVHADRLHIPVTKNGRPFDLPINGRHHAILRPLRRLDPEWVFPARKAEVGHLVSPKRIPWSPHAHRRTFATVAMEAGVIEEVVGRLLNHTPLSITGHRYVRPSLEALRPAMETICVALSKRMAVE